ncbi:autophagy-related protein 2 homolog A [Hypanus sabinus]|uniref:autophagy-related protein 2 homolog A n=1 Tax=Hypanus sabinus TaxID=79690 RepID=UPI0028C40670|nr:autophagy-related protein 2 homolog A [Hypanus sabinus]
MSWFFPWSSSIKMRACCYLLQHYLGHFFEERLTLEQLSLDLYNGSGRIRDVQLDVWSLNEFLDSLGVPLEMTDGFISSISVTIPWSALITDNCTVEVSGLQITCRPKYCFAPGTESPSWSSCMTTSMQLAKECLQEQSEEPTQPLEGLEMFAQTIETVLRKIKVTFLDTIVRVEHTPDSSRTGVALEMHIKRLEYCDEAVKDSVSTAKKDPIPIDIHQPPAFVHKVLQFSGVLLHYEDVLEQEVDPPLSSPLPQQEELNADPTPDTSSRPAERRSAVVSSQLVQIGSCTGCVEMTIKLKQNDALPGPKLELDGKMGALHLFLSPHQLSNLTDLLGTLSLSEVSGLTEKLSKSRPLDPEDFKLIEQDLNKQLHSGQSLARSRTEEFELLTGTENGVSSEMFFSMAPMTSSVASVQTVSEMSEVDLGGSMYSDYSSSPLQAPSLGTGLLMGSPRRSGGSLFPSGLPSLQSVSRQQGRSQQPPSLDSVKTEVLLKLTFGGVTATLLHLECKPPATLPAATRHYFTELTYFKDAIFGGRDFTHTRRQFERACPRSNIRLIGSAVQLACEQKTGRGVQFLCADACFGAMEILESLWPAGTQHRVEYTELLIFRKSPAVSGESSACPCAQVHYRQTCSEEGKGTRRRSGTKCSAELVVELQEAHADVDVSFLDRVDPLLRAWPTPEREFVAEQSRSAEPTLLSGLSAVRADPPPTQGRPTVVQITAPSAHLRLQFPVPDLRRESERRPWFQKAVRKESLLLECRDLVFRSELGARSATDPVKYELSFTDLHGVYEDGLKPGISCIRVNKTSDKVAGTKCTTPKIVLTVNPDYSGTQWDLLMEKTEDIDLSTVESPCELKQPEPSPFSSKRTMYETEEMVIPGEPEEMAEFQSQTLASSQYILELTLPALHLLLPSKEFYQNIYNRFNNDLLMWTPTGPSLDSPSQSTDTTGINPLPLNSMLGAPFAHDNFRLCKSAFRLDSDSEDEDSHFYSNEESGRRRKMEGRRGHAQSFVSAVVNVGKGRVTALTDSKGEAGKAVSGFHGELVLDVENGTIFSVSQYKGQLELGYLCIESSKVSLYQKADVEDYPLPEMLEVPSFTAPAGLPPTILFTDEVLATGSSAAPGRRDRSLRMLAVAIKTTLDTTNNIKEFLVALRLQGATLCHRMALANQSWHEQLMDFFDVLDEPILGYVPPNVITVLHTHLLSCALDYRPLYLPLRVLITAETFTLSSNIIVDTATFHLRYSHCETRQRQARGQGRDGLWERQKELSVGSLGWDPRGELPRSARGPAAGGALRPRLGFNITAAAYAATLSLPHSYPSLYPHSYPSLYPHSYPSLRPPCQPLSPTPIPTCREAAEPRHSGSVQSLTAVSPHTDYVCVLDIDLLELVITTWKGDLTGKPAQPLFELRCSNNVVHVHTCADSCAALANLIQYVVNSGDLHPPPRQDTPTEIAGQRLQLPESAPVLPPRFPAETAEINQGDLTDALIDTERSRRDSADGTAGGMPLLRQDSPVSVYLFPGENNQDKPAAKLPPMADRLDVFPSEGSEAGSDSTDNDDFCILDAPGMGIPPKDGEPVVSKLTDETIVIKDGYFSRPIGSTDLLKAPSRFPVPDTRIMLREISVVWHLYGGKDFGSLRPSSFHSHSPRMKPVAVSARSSPSRSAFPNRPQNTWRMQGGSGRNHDILMEIQLTKVSFQHETYPVATAMPEKGSMELRAPELEELPIARQVFIVQELEIRDRLASSQINKFLYLYTSEKMPRRAHSNMLTIKALHVRPESGLGGPECCLRVSLMPLRLNIDQDALFFLKDFFTAFATGINPVVPVDSAVEAKPESSQRSSGIFEAESCQSGLEMPEMTASMETAFSEHSSSSAASSSEQPIYFREFRFISEVPIWLDYHGKTRNHGSTLVLNPTCLPLGDDNTPWFSIPPVSHSVMLMLLVYTITVCVGLSLRLLGVDKVINYALTEWLLDIRKNQLPGILGGVGPMHSVVQLFHGLRDLFWLPIEQYRKDGRIIRGLQRGAASFGTSTASAALELSNRLVQAIQATAETVYDILSPTPPVTKAIMDQKYLKRYRRIQQPADLREGVAKAYDTVREGVIDTAQTICDVATRGHEQKGITGAVGGVLRQIPPTVVKPLIVASEATSNLLGGMRNQIKPDARKEESLKWRTDEAHE